MAFTPECGEGDSMDILEYHTTYQHDTGDFPDTLFQECLDVCLNQRDSCRSLNWRQDGTCYLSSTVASDPGIILEADDDYHYGEKCVHSEFAFF